MPSLEDTERLARELDSADPLAGYRSRFVFPGNSLYFDGNSLGLLSLDAEREVHNVLDQWKTHAIGGYSLPRPESWYYTGEELGTLMAPLVGAEPHEVVVTGTTTVNLHQMLATFYRPSGRRTRIVATTLDFPTDIHAMQSQIRLHGGDPLRDLCCVSSRDGRTIDEEDIVASMDGTVAIALLPSVLYRSGQLLDIPRLVQAARAKGILIGFDCAHSVGVVPHRLSEADADFAVWCSYKYLNAGPGAPAALYVNKRHHRRLPGLAGWWGHDKQSQFDMAHSFTPAGNAGGWQISSIPQLSAAPLRASLKMISEVGIERIREKSLKLTNFLMALIRDLRHAPYGFSVSNPLEAHRRGGHVAIVHAEAARICKCLKARGVVPDFRMPDVIRLAPVPLYNTFHEVWQVVRHLRQIIDTKEFEQFTPGRDLIA